MTVVGTPFSPKYLAGLVAMVVFPDPPFELITSVVFILISFAPFPHRATEKRQDYAKVMVCVINYFTGEAKNPWLGSWACPGAYDRNTCRRPVERSFIDVRHFSLRVKLVSIRFAIVTLTGRHDFADHGAAGRESLLLRIRASADCSSGGRAFVHRSGGYGLNTFLRGTPLPLRLVRGGPVA